MREYLKRQDNLFGSIFCIARLIFREKRRASVSEMTEQFAWECISFSKINLREERKASVSEMAEKFIWKYILYSESIFKRREKSKRI